MAHHYVYGSGMSGCLYDNGPHTAKTLDEAIASLSETFGDLDEAELRRMGNHLRAEGYYSFSDPSEAGADYCDAKQEESDPKVAALAEHLGESYGSISETRRGTFESEEQRGEWRVLDEAEREEAADEALESYIDECLEIPESIKHYFDGAKWKRDALLSDGYGHTLSPYDGEEHEEQIDGVWYYIYRVN